MFGTVLGLANTFPTGLADNYIFHGLTIFELILSYRYGEVHRLAFKIFKILKIIKDFYNF